MIIQFSDNYSKDKKLEYEFILENINFDGEKISFISPIKVDGDLKVKNDILTLDVDIETDIKLVCSRCLEKFSLPININVEEKFTNNKSMEEDDGQVVFIQGDSIDITDAIINDIISTLPIKRLCSENCKGLCQICGTNLNQGNCTCNNGDVDIRLAKLKDLFS
jgi:uncharacterized protein